MDWESTDKRTDKERFFDGLYSILTDDDLPETSEVTLLLAASRNQRNATTRRSIPRSTRASTATPRAPGVVPKITRASTMPLPKSTGLASTAPVAPPPSLPLPSVSTPPQHSPPPESSRMLGSSSADGKVAKRKRVAKATPTPNFIPNDLKNPVRKFRVQKTDEHGGFCLNEWREKNITHIIVDSRLNYEDVLKYLKQDSIPEHIVVVNENFIGDCLDFNRIVSYDQPQYRVPGNEPTSSPQLPETSSPAASSSATPVQNLRIKPKRSKRISETQRSTQEPTSTPYSTSQLSEASPEGFGAAVTTSNATVMVQKLALDQGLLKGKAPSTAAMTPGVSAAAPQSTSEQRVPEGLTAEGICERSKDELDIMIEEAQKMGNLPSLDDDDDLDQKSSGTQRDTSSEDEESLTRAKKKKLASKMSKSERLGGWQGAFQCMRKNEGTEGDENPNKRTIEILSEMQKYYEMTGDQWRSISYRKAINTLKKQEKKIVFASEALELFNIGSSIAEKIEEIVRTDHLRKLDYTKLEPADAALKLFLGIYGVGSALAHQWVHAGYRTLEDLKTKVKLSQSQKIGVDHHDDFNCRIPRDEVKRHGDIVTQIAKSIDPELQLEILGSYRRGAKDCGDIDIMITKEGADASWLSGLLDELVEKLFSADFLQCGLAIPRGRDDGSKWHGASKVSGISQWRRIDFLVVPWDERGAALLYFTGNDIFNRSMRLLASKKGYGLNQHGLFKNVMRGAHREKLTDGTKIEGQDEKRIFEILGVPYRPPEERIC